MAKFVSVAVIAIFGAGCATVAPKELVNARRAYERAVVGPAAQVAPAEVHKAKQSLDQAELAFVDKPKAQHTRDLAYVAERKAQLATAIGAIRVAQRAREVAEKDYLAKQRFAAGETKDALAQTRRHLASSERDRDAGVTALGNERTARLDAENRAKDAADALAKLAAVKEEARGLVITLSGSVLFASNQTTLLPAAQTRLTQVSSALMATKERNLIVEGHTDSQGSSDYNLGLSQRRAEAVRSFLVSQGYPSSRIQARGIGKDRPVSGNASAEGRANNRRVEIIVEPKLSASR